MNTLLQALLCSTPLALVACAPLTNDNDDVAGGPRWLPVEHERDGIVETWAYDDEVRLLAVDERVVCRCEEQPRQLSRFSYSDRRAQRAIDRDADGDDDEVLLVLRDEFGRVTRFERDLVGADAQSLTFTYDDAGRVVGEADEDGSQRTAVRDAAGRVTTLLDNGVVFTRYTYDDAGRTTGITSGDDTTAYHYDDDGRMVAQRTARPNNFDITSTYLYDDDGQLIGIRATDNENDNESDNSLTTIDFGYDDGRLVSRVSVDLRTNVTSIMEATYDELGRPLLFTTSDGYTTSTTSRAYVELGDNDVEVTTTDEGGSRVTRFRRFATPLRDDLTLPSLYVEFPDRRPWFDEPFVEPN
jgi:YD repeat-containing protein